MSCRVTVAFSQATVNAHLVAATWTTLILEHWLFLMVAVDHTCILCLCRAAAGDALKLLGESLAFPPLRDPKGVGRASFLPPC